MARTRAKYNRTIRSWDDQRIPAAELCRKRGSGSGRPCGNIGLLEKHNQEILVEDQTYIVIVFLDCELNLLNAIIFMLSRLNDVLVKY